MCNAAQGNAAFPEVRRRVAVTHQRQIVWGYRGYGRCRTLGPNGTAHGQMAIRGHTRLRQASLRHILDWQHLVPSQCIFGKAGLLFGHGQSRLPYSESTAMLPRSTSRTSSSTSCPTWRQPAPTWRFPVARAGHRPVHHRHGRWDMDPFDRRRRHPRAPGDDGRAAVRLSAEELTDIVFDLQTPMTLLTAGTLRMERGNLGDFLDWWVVLRSLIDGVPVHTAGSIDVPRSRRRSARPAHLVRARRRPRRRGALSGGSRLSPPRRRVHRSGDGSGVGGYRRRRAALPA